MLYTTVKHANPTCQKPAVHMPRIQCSWDWDQASKVVFSTLCFSNTVKKTLVTLCLCNLNHINMHSGVVQDIGQL